MRVLLHPGIESIDKRAWRTLEPPDFPFFDYEFLAALERSGSVGGGSGWSPAHLLCEAEEGGDLLGALPLYVKTDSYGEYIFDWEWAYAYQQHGMSYYPKLVSAVPFTPATGPKLLTRPESSKEERESVRRTLLAAVETLGDERRVSSSHALFVPGEEVSEFEERGFAVRHSMQFHWRNRGHDTFQDYLDALESKRRRQISRERRQLDEDLRIERLTGDALTDEHARTMFDFYLDTSDRKWGNPYLTEEFFREVFETMRDRTLLVLARDGSGRAIAGALNFYKGDSLYGRNWGASEERRNLHFEVCYYQAIEFAIERRFTLFEAGAQGEHKLARGFLPTLTYSAHEIRHPAFRRAIEDYIAEEREMVDLTISEYSRHTPYKD